MAPVLFVYIRGKIVKIYVKKNQNKLSHNTVSNILFQLFSHLYYNL